MKNIVVEIQRWSVSDGPGTRTVVFLKGCPLHCPWCANPESQDGQPQIGIFPARCVECHACARECPEEVAIPAKNGAFSDDRCTQCGKCIAVCHSGARAWLGEEMSVTELIQIIKKDMVFYRKSSGGVTFSGGEPLAQPEFLKAVIEECQKLGIHAAIETCGFFNWEYVKDTVRLADFILFDIKHMGSKRHKAITGVANKRILENAKKIARLDIPLVIRIPVIPSINDSKANIRATARFVRNNLPGALGIEMLPYHRLGLSKYAALGLDYKLHHIQPPDDAYMQMLRNLVAAEGVSCITADSGYEFQLSQPKLKVVG
ncbi:MAG: glycyl-radical enzyme activating protein [Desulfobacterales bacterium]|jgi:pyruvate formate lyase activating enzyme